MILLAVTVGLAMASLFNRYDRVDHFKNRLIRMEYDINVCKHDLKQKQLWAERLQSDLTALEQVARDKMNYLGPDEVLVTFSPILPQ